MKPGFCLNLHSRELNPCFESHDPSMMWDSVGKMYYSYSTDAALTSKYRQGIPVRRSIDLIDFTFMGYALSDAAIAQGRDNGAGNAPTGGFWAPFTEYCGGEYRMYYSATKAFGSSESRIWLAVADNPLGPFENRGVVMDTWNTPDTEPNAIDAHVADTPEGRKFLIYGSFFGGIFLKELNPGDGMPLDPDPKYQGIRLARKPKDSLIDGPEGASVIYNPDTEYYYLFLSYGWLGDDYDIRGGRSREITGPYVDYLGKSLDGESLGLKLAGSYCFSAEAPCAGTERRDWSFAGFRGPGHGVPFYAPDKKEYFFVHHVRDGAKIFCRKGKDRQSFRMHYMTVRRMYFADGWPLFSPEPYAGEKADAVPLTGREELAESSWEWLRLRYDDNGLAEAREALLPEELIREKTLVFPCYDFENSREGTALCGLTREGQIIWAKKRG